MRLAQKLLLVYMPLVTIPAVLGIAAVTWIHGLLYREQMTLQAETVLRTVSDKIERQFLAYESAMLPYYTDPATLAILDASPNSSLDQYRLQQEAENRYFTLMGSRELAWIDAFILISRSNSIYLVGDRNAVLQALPLYSPVGNDKLDASSPLVAKIRNNGGAAVWEVVSKERDPKLVVGRTINRVSGSRFESLGVMLLIVDPDVLKASLDTETLGKGTEYALNWKNGEALLDTQSRQTHSLNMLTLSAVDDRYGWQLQLRLPLSFYKEALGTSLLVAIVITLICLLIGLWVTRMIATDVVLPIRRLSRSMVRGVGKSEPVRLDNFRGATEIVELKDTFVAVMAEIRQLNQEILLTQKKRQEATMKALEHRLAPHFLYNTLNTIRWMAIIQQQHNIKDMVDALTRLLSYSIREVDKPVPLREELDVLSDYMKIQTVRYEHHALRMDVPDTLLKQPILKLLIQPLIENAIIHGLSKVERTGEIALTVKARDERLEIRIADNGQGMTGEQLALLRESVADEAERGKSFGLRSIRERIQLHYGEDYGLTIDSEYGAGTTVVLHLPLLAPFEKEDADENGHDR
jgi:sensor histidine kinase YesM